MAQSVCILLDDEVRPDPVIARLVGAILLEQNDEWAAQRPLHDPGNDRAIVSDDPIVRLPAAAA